MNNENLLSSPYIHFPSLPSLNVNFTGDFGRIKNILYHNNGWIYQNSSNIGYHQKPITPLKQIYYDKRGFIFKKIQPKIEIDKIAEINQFLIPKECILDTARLDYDHSRSIGNLIDLSLSHDQNDFILFSGGANGSRLNLINEDLSIHIKYCFNIPINQLKCTLPNIICVRLFSTVVYLNMYQQSDQTKWGIKKIYSLSSESYIEPTNIDAGLYEQLVSFSDGTVAFFDNEILSRKRTTITHSSLHLSNYFSKQDRVRNFVCKYHSDNDCNLLIACNNFQQVLLFDRRIKHECYSLRVTGENLLDYASYDPYSVVSLLDGEIVFNDIRMPSMPSSMRIKTTGNKLTVTDKHIFTYNTTDGKSDGINCHFISTIDGILQVVDAPPSSLVTTADDDRKKTMRGFAAKKIDHVLKIYHLYDDGSLFSQSLECPISRPHSNILVDVEKEKTTNSWEIEYLEPKFPDQIITKLFLKPFEEINFSPLIKMINETPLNQKLRLKEEKKEKNTSTLHNSLTAFTKPSTENNELITLLKEKWDDPTFSLPIAVASDKTSLTHKSTDKSLFDNNGEKAKDSSTISASIPVVKTSASNLTEKIPGISTFSSLQLGINIPCKPGNISDTPNSFSLTSLYLPISQKKELEKSKSTGKKPGF